MGVRIVHDREQDVAVLFCSTSDWAFGPVFHNDDRQDADERAEAFLRWLQRSCVQTGDPRGLDEAELQRAYSQWLAQEYVQRGREERQERAKGCVGEFLITSELCTECGQTLEDHEQ